MKMKPVIDRTALIEDLLERIRPLLEDFVDDVLVADKRVERPSNYREIRQEVLERAGADFDRRFEDYVAHQTSRPRISLTNAILSALKNSDRGLSQTEIFDRLPAEGYDRRPKEDSTRATLSRLHKERQVWKAADSRWHLIDDQVG